MAKLGLINELSVTNFPGTTRSRDYFYDDIFGISLQQILLRKICMFCLV